MKPVYFPHTFMSAPVAASLQTWFPSVVSYQPVAGHMPEVMQPLVQGGFLEVLVPGPLAEKPQRCEALMREMEQWGRRHYAGMGLKAAYRCADRWFDPFGDDGLVSEVCAAIRGRMAAAMSAEPVDPLAAAAIFLQFAQLFDAQNQQSEESMEQFERMNAQLFASLTGEAEPEAANPGPLHGRRPGPHGEYLLESRIEAWVRLFLSHPYPSPVFVTCHATVAELLLDRFSTMRRFTLADIPERKARRGSETPSSQRDLISSLGVIAGSPEPLPMLETRRSSGARAQNDITGDPVIYLVPEIAPIELFSRFLPDGRATTGSPAGHDGWRHTLIVHVA